MLLHRLPDSRMSEVRPAWEGATAVLMGSGPSLTREHVETVRSACASSEAFSIAINATYLWAPWADVCYFADVKFWRWHTEGVAMPGLNLTAEQVKERFASFAGQKCSIEHGESNRINAAVHLLKNKGGKGNHSEGISNDPTGIATGKHSGYQAVNIAILSGASKILLLGYDGTETNGRSHFHGGHPTKTPTSAYQMYREAFAKGENAINASARVLNCSPGSKIMAFERSTIEKELGIESNEGNGARISATL